jgi:hypothetical protein
MFDQLGGTPMGAWGIGPFHNDDAADFAGDLDELDGPGRAAAIHDALSEAVEETEYLDASVGAIAVAAAAIVATQQPGGEAVDPEYGPKEPVPALPETMPTLAVQALDRVLAGESALRELWDSSDERQSWLDEIEDLRRTLGR